MERPQSIEEKVSSQSLNKFFINWKIKIRIKNFRERFIWSHFDKPGSKGPRDIVEMCQSSIKTQRDFFDGIERPNDSLENQTYEESVEDHSFEIPVEIEDAQSVAKPGL